MSTHKNYSRVFQNRSKKAKVKVKQKVLERSFNKIPLADIYNRVFIFVKDLGIGHGHRAKKTYTQFVIARFSVTDNTHKGRHN
jgi:hypothetical protein